MADATRDTKSARRARENQPRSPRHAVPSLYAPSPRESVVAATLAVALLAVLALVLANSGGSAAAERNQPAAAPKLPPAIGPALVDPGSTSLGSAITSAIPVLATSGAVRAPSSVSTLFPGISTGVGTGVASSLAATGIPATALAAYKQAAARQDALTPSCRISWPLLAGIGRVESNHGRFAGAVLHTDGLSTPPVIGIPLNGNGTAVIRDTDGGRLDGDTTYDRAVGPMQFIPSTWARWAVDADHDGVKNPFDIFDATAAAAAYLCAAGRDLGTYQGQVAAILSYNHSSAYVATVMGVERVYASGGGVSVPDAPGAGQSGPVATPTLPPVDPGTPRGVHSSTSSHPRSTHSSARSTSTRPSSTPKSSSTSKSSTSPRKSTSPTCPSSSSPSASGSSSSSDRDSSSSSPSDPPSGCPAPSSSSTSPQSPDATGQAHGNAADAGASDGVTSGASGS